MNMDFRPLCLLSNVFFADASIATAADMPVQVEQCACHFNPGIILDDPKATAVVSGDNGFSKKRFAKNENCDIIPGIGESIENDLAK